jgi:hypothetical protein
MTNIELVTKLYRTTVLDYDQAYRLVDRGLMLGWTADQMGQFGEYLSIALTGAARGLSYTQLFGWYNACKLVLLVDAVGYGLVEPRDVPDTPPISPTLVLRDAD